MRAAPDRAANRPLVAVSSERKTGMRRQIGQANYSYVFVEDAFLALLQRQGYRVARVPEPEIFKTPLSYEALLGVEPHHVTHIAFRSTENLRPMQGARNICHFAWEFDVLKNSGLATDSVLSNQVHMLKLMDEIWVGCEFTRAVLHRYGVDKTYVVPAPIVGDELPRRLAFAQACDALSTTPALPLIYVGALSRDENCAMAADRIAPLADLMPPPLRHSRKVGSVFLSILSPGDLRKNLLNLIDGFQLAQGHGCEDDILIVKLAVPNQGDFRIGGLFDSLSPLCRHQMAKQDDRVIFIFDYLTDQKMDALFNMADFYISASHCEGYNLPLLQAMTRGVVPISTHNTAMVDYIHRDNAIVIEERRIVSPIKGMAADVAGDLYEIGFATRFDIAKAIVAAHHLGQSRFEELGDAARRTVLAQYGERRVAQLIASRIDQIAAPEATPHG